MKLLRSLVLAGLVAVLAPALALAQQATPVQQSGSMLNAAQFLQGTAGGATSCSTVATSTANGTVTITPPAGLFVYVTGVYIDITADATGTTSTNTMSTTNLTGGPIWSLATIVPTANSMGQFRQLSETFATPLKSTVAGTAVTFVPSGTTAHNIICTRVAGYFAP